MSLAKKWRILYASPWDDEETLMARLQMVAEQIVGRGIRDTRVIEAMRDIPRHVFVPEDQRPFAYVDGALPIGLGQTISQPYIVALMTEALALRGQESVLEIGTGSGYQAAILGRLAKAVYSIERIGELVERAKKALARLGVLNVKVLHANGTVGLSQAAPFDAIVVTAGGPDIPRPLVEQLAEGGRMVLPVGERGEQELVRLVKSGKAVLRETLGLCAFVPLIGEAGWSDESQYARKETHHADPQ